MLKIKGHSIPKPEITTSFSRRAVAIKNHILNTLKRLGVDADHADIPMETFATRKTPASISWYFGGRNLKYTYGQMPRFIENLYVIDKILEIEIERLISGEITLDQFSNEFSEDDDHLDQLKEARKTLGIDEEEKDFQVISKSYKKLARIHHPDMPNGSHEEFQKINAAHKLIQKELM